MFLSPISIFLTESSYLVTNGKLRSRCNVSLVTYQGISTTILRYLFWNLCNISILELKAVPHNWTPLALKSSNTFEDCLKNPGEMYVWKRMFLPFLHHYWPKSRISSASWREASISVCGRFSLLMAFHRELFVSGVTLNTCLDILVSPDFFSSPVSF